MSERDYEDYQENAGRLTPGLTALVEQILNTHMGKAAMFDRVDLLELVHQTPGYERITDRKMRRAIELLRQKGVRICHHSLMVKKAGKSYEVFGYYLAADELEYLDFREKFTTYAESIAATTMAMDRKRPLTARELELARSILDASKNQQNLAGQQKFEFAEVSNAQ